MRQRRLTRGWPSRLAGMAVFLLLWAMQPAPAGAVEYDTYSRDSYGRQIQLQPAYYPVGFMAHDLRLPAADGAGDPGLNVHLNQPEDLFIASDDTIYIADTLNNRIVQLAADGSLLRLIAPEQSPLKSPTGVAVTAAGDIFVADNGNQRVVKLGSDGRWLAQYGRPEGAGVPAKLVYEPYKLAVDARGYMYVLSKGSYQGIVLLAPDGAFQSFIGTNATKATIFDVVKRMLYSEEQLRRQARLLPDTVNALEIDGEGFIYTATSNAEGEQVKKLNFAGLNLFQGLAFNPEGRGRPKYNDLAVDERGMLTVLEADSNTISQYAPDGQLLFYWQSSPMVGRSTLGAMNDPAAADTNSRGELFILDRHQGVIQRFALTHFGRLVQDAALLSLDGRYAESVPLWEEIHRLNAQYSLAHDGLAQAAEYRQQYSDALRLYRLAGNQEGYSDTFWQLRLDWFQQHFTLLANSVLGAVAGALLLRRWIARGWRGAVRLWERLADRFPLLRQLQQAAVVLRHPIDGFVDLRYRERGSYASALILLLLAVGVLLAKQYYTGYPFTSGPPEEASGGLLAARFGLLWLTWAICNYLISSITQGEGRFKDVFIGSAYALSPLIAFGLPAMVLSNALTLSEAAIYGFFDAVIWIWCGLLVFWKIQALHNYSVGEAARNAASTLLAALMLWLLGFIVYGLAAELLQFVRAIYQEVMIR